MSQEEFENLLFLSSVQLDQLGTDRIPLGFASGAIVEYYGKRLLFTVSHATGNNGNWAIRLRYVQGRGMQCYQLGAMNFLVKATLLDPAFNDVDFSYVEIPETIVAYRQDVELPDTVINETQITIHQTSLNEIPNCNERFGFCGMVMPSNEEHFGRTYIGGEIRIYSGLEYIRTVDDYYVFRLPFDHPGHEHFQGCSGAPVLSESGVLVGLLCGGNQATNEIYVISLKAYKMAVDLLVGNVN